MQGRDVGDDSCNNTACSNTRKIGWVADAAQTKGASQGRKHVLSVYYLRSPSERQTGFGFDRKDVETTDVRSIGVEVKAFCSPLHEI